MDPPFPTEKLTETCSTVSSESPLLPAGDEFVDDDFEMHMQVSPQYDDLPGILNFELDSHSSADFEHMFWEESATTRCADSQQTDLLWSLAGGDSPELDAQDVPVLEALPVHDGQTGGVYLLTGPTSPRPGSPEPFKTIFKPVDEERFERRGIQPGTGAVREEAAFVIDRMSGGQANVPVTTRASFEEGGAIKRGSVQAFVTETCGAAEDFGMPRDVGSAAQMVSVDVAQAVACFDIRVFNTDRHPGNLLMAGSRPYQCVCIDHGCVLPAWWALDMAQFDAWMDWPQVKVPPTAGTLRIVEKAVLCMGSVLMRLQKLELPKDSLWTYRICTVLLEKCVLNRHKSLHEVAGLLIREPPEQPSWLEMQIQRACDEAGIPSRFTADENGFEVFHVDESYHQPFPYGGKSEISAAIEARFFEVLFAIFEDYANAGKEGC